MAALDVVHYAVGCGSHGFLLSTQLLLVGLGLRLVRIGLGLLAPPGGALVVVAQGENRLLPQVEHTWELVAQLGEHLLQPTLDVGVRAGVVSLQLGQVVLGVLQKQAEEAEP